jgi:heptosyltransferase I
MLRAIRKHWPETGITWIIGKLEYRLLERLEGVEFIVFDKRGGWSAVRALRKALKGRRFDALLHMQVALRANLLSRLIEAPIRLGWNRERSRDRHQWFINQQVRHVPFQHQVPAFLEFARALGVPVESPEWLLPVTDDDRAWAAKMLPAGRPVLMISPCSSHELRNWSVASYARVADHAQSDLGMRVVITGGPSELEARTGAAIEAAASHPVTNLVGKDTLTQSMALLERAAVLLSPDSGPVHIASALGTPVLGLYAATWSRRSGPYNSLDLCVDRFDEAARKYRHKPAEELRWGTRIEVPGVMDLIRPQEVIGKLEGIARRRDSNPGLARD